MHLFIGEQMYIVDDREIRDRGLNMLVPLVDLGKITHEEFLEEFERREPQDDIQRMD